MVEYEEAKQYADENGLLFMETSAKTALNVNEIFLAIGEKTKSDLERKRWSATVSVFFSAKKLPKNEGGANQGQNSGRRLDQNEQSKQSSNCCKWCPYSGEYIMRREGLQCSATKLNLSLSLRLFQAEEEIDRFLVLSEGELTLFAYKTRECRERAKEGERRRRRALYI